MYSVDFDNPWVRDADAIRRITAAGIAVAAPLLVFGALQLGHLAMQLSLALQVSGKAALALIQTAVVFLPLSLVAIVGARLAGRRIWRRDARPLMHTGVGLILGTAGFLSVAGLLFLVGAATPAAAPPSTALNVLAGAIVVAVQATAEEMFFRGWIQPNLCARLGPWAGLAATSLLFALLHLIAGGRSLPSLANTALAGFVFGLLALRTGGLWAPVAAHFGWNYAEAHILGLDPNPGLNSLGSLLNLEATGATVWSGSHDGMNGSLATGLVLGAWAIALVLVRGRREPA